MENFLPASLHDPATRKLVYRAILVGALVIYSITALAVSGSRALPLLFVDLALLAYAAALFLRRRRRNKWIPSRRTHGWFNTPAARIALAAVVVLVHVIMVAALGARTSERWLPVIGLTLLVLGCYAGSTQRDAVRWRTGWEHPGGAGRATRARGAPSRGSHS